MNLSWLFNGILIIYTFLYFFIYITLLRLFILRYALNPKITDKLHLTHRKIQRSEIQWANNL